MLTLCSLEVDWASREGGISSRYLIIWGLKVKCLSISHLRRCHHVTHLPQKSLCILMILSRIQHSWISYHLQSPGLLLEDELYVDGAGAALRGEDEDVEGDSELVR